MIIERGLHTSMTLIKMHIPSNSHGVHQCPYLSSYRIVAAKIAVKILDESSTKSLSNPPQGD